MVLTKLWKHRSLNFHNFDSLSLPHLPAYYPHPLWLSHTSLCIIKSILYACLTICRKVVLLLGYLIHMGTLLERISHWRVVYLHPVSCHITWNQFCVLYSMICTPWQLATGRSAANLLELQSVFYGSSAESTEYYSHIVTESTEQ